MSLTIPPNSIVITSTYPALAARPSFPAPGNYHVHSEGGESLGMKMGKSRHVSVSTNVSPSTFTLTANEEGIVQLFTLLEGKKYFLDKRWGTHNGINQRTKKSCNHEVDGYALIKEWEVREKENLAQYWRLHPCEDGFKLSPLCSPELFLMIDEEGFARCNTTGQVFSFIPV